MRLAWFSPLPPAHSGIAAYSAERIPGLLPHHDIDVFVDAPNPDTTGQLAEAEARGWLVPRGPRGTVPARPAREAPPHEGRPRVWPAGDFVRLHDQRPYDLSIYQLGNAAFHDYVWAYAFRVPGLLVLHDGTVHHARARALLRRGRVADYRAEFCANHPAADPVLAEHAVQGFTGTHYYRWPMRRLIVERSRAVAVHSAQLVADLTAECPETVVVRIRLGLPDPGHPPRPACARIPPGAVVFGAFGLLTPEKRIPLLLEAFATVFGTSGHAHLLLVGGTTEYYDVRAEVARLGIAQHVTLTGYVPDEELDAWHQVPDACLCLRWPTGGETSATWLRCLAAGKPPVVSGLRQHLEVPALDARTGAILGSLPGEPAARSWHEAVCVSVDLVEEREALCQALRRLAESPELRRTLGANARRYWERHQRLPHAAADYEAAIRVALGRVPTESAERLPPHLLGDPGGLAWRIATTFGVAIDVAAQRALPAPPRP
jgi:glycosyltransferase involved in cell wall biosynthesis